MANPHPQIRPGNPAFPDLPWDIGVDDWDSHRLVEMPAGIHRHPVVFVAYDEGICAIKELPMRLAREWATAIHLTSWWTPQAHFFDKRTGERICAKRPAASVSG